MDESKPSLPSDELSLRPASPWKSAVVDVPPANLAKSDKLVAPGRQCHSDESELCRDDLPNGPSVVVFCGNEEEVSRIETRAPSPILQLISALQIARGTL